MARSPLRDQHLCGRHHDQRRHAAARQRRRHRVDLGNVLNNGTFAINRSDTFTFGGNISGTGAFQQIGTGTTILTASNTYSGGTFFNAGTLAVAADANLGAPTGGLTFTGGTFQALASFDTSRGVTLNTGGGTFDTNGNALGLTGAIAGVGGLTKVGLGTLTLTGSNTYTGGTTISAGTLQLGNGGTTGSILGNVVNNGTFAINRSDTFTFDGNISGTGAFQQIGTGTTTLTGNSTYTGARPSTAAR